MKFSTRAADLRDGNPAGNCRAKRRRKSVGFARALPSDERALRLADLPWQDVEGGMRAARITIRSPGAAGLAVLALCGDG